MDYIPLKSDEHFVRNMRSNVQILGAHRLAPSRVPALKVPPKCELDPHANLSLSNVDAVQADRIRILLQWNWQHAVRKRAEDR